MLLEFKDSWDIFLVLKKEKYPIIYINTTLPLVKRITKNYLWTNDYPLVYALYFICQSIEGRFIDSSMVLSNLISSHLSTQKG